MAKDRNRHIYIPMMYYTDLSEDCNILVDKLHWEGRRYSLYLHMAWVHALRLVTEINYYYKRYKSPCHIMIDAHKPSQIKFYKTNLGKELDYNAYGELDYVCDCVGVVQRSYPYHGMYDLIDELDVIRADQSYDTGGDRYDDYVFGETKRQTDETLSWYAQHTYLV